MGPLIAAGSGALLIAGMILVLAGLKRQAGMQSSPPAPRSLRR